MAIEAVKSQAASYQAQSVSQAPKPTQSASNHTSQTTQAKPVESVKMENISLDAKEESEAKIASQNEQVKKAVTDINKKMADTSCQFGINDTTNRVTIKIVDNSTKEVIKEYPAEETLKMIEKAWELAGIMVDEKL